jgi:hypothetical protein
MVETIILSSDIELGVVSRQDEEISLSVVELSSHLQQHPISSISVTGSMVMDEISVSVRLLHELVSRSQDK